MDSIEDAGRVLDYVAPATEQHTITFVGGAGAWVAALTEGWRARQVVCENQIVGHTIGDAVFRKNVVEDCTRRVHDRARDLGLVVLHTASRWERCRNAAMLSYENAWQVGVPVNGEIARCSVVALAVPGDAFHNLLRRWAAGWEN